MAGKPCSPEATDMHSQLQAHVSRIMDDAVKSPLLQGGQFSTDKLQKPRLRARGLVQALAKKLEGLPVSETQQGLTDLELRYCAAIIASAFLNPVMVGWDYDRFSESAKKRVSDKFFIKNQLGSFSKPGTIVDIHGKILVWYLPGLLLPHQVQHFSRTVTTLKGALLSSCQQAGSWREKGFISDPSKSSFGAGRLGISIGRLIPGHKRLIDPLYPTPNLKTATFRKWLKMIEPWGQLLDAVLQVIHPEMWLVNMDARNKLICGLQIPGLTWPTCYAGMDVIVNRVTPSHYDAGGAYTFYDQLLSLGGDHDAKFCLDDLGAEFDYQAGAGIWLTGRGLTHSVPPWTKGERIVIAHYAKDDVHDRLEISRPPLPSQAQWYLRHSLM